VSEARREYYRKWCAANPDKVKAAQERYRAKHPDRVKASHKRWRDRNRAKWNASRRKWRAKNPCKHSADIHRWRAVERATREGHARRMFRTAAKSGKKCCITVDDILAAWPSTDACPVLNTPFAYGVTAREDGAAPSLDRVDSRLGYEPGNIAVISWRANEMKRAYSVVEISALARWMQLKELF
jgi:hypothetical protein